MTSPTLDTDAASEESRSRVGDRSTFPPSLGRRLPQAWMPATARLIHEVTLQPLTGVVFSAGHRRVITEGAVELTLGLAQRDHKRTGPDSDRKVPHVLGKATPSLSLG